MISTNRILDNLAFSHRKGASALVGEYCVVVDGVCECICIYLCMRCELHYEFKWLWKGLVRRISSFTYGRRRIWSLLPWFEVPLGRDLPEGEGRW